MIATKRFWTAKPFLLAYLLAVCFTVGILVNRAPSGGQVVPTLAAHSGNHGDVEREPPEPSLWQQLFHPSQPTARWLLRMGLPMLSVADGSAQAAERRTLRVSWAGQAGDQPQTFFESMLPFLRNDKPGAQADAGATPPGTPTPGAAAPGGGQPSAEPGTPDSKPQSKPPDNSRPAAVAGGQPLVGIYHTHDWESYISEFPGFVPKTPDDLNKIQSMDHTKHTVMDVGRALALRLNQLGVGTVWADYSHQDLGYDYAYKSSRNTIKDILAKAPSVKVLIDLHRDSGWGVDETTVIGGQNVAKVRCIIGKQDPHWEQNKAFCESLMQRMEDKHPGLTLPTRVQDDNYNQDILPGAILIEVGRTLNQYAEADRSTQYVAEALVSLLREGAYPH